MENAATRHDNPDQDFIVTHPLFPTGPAEQLFIAGASVFEITSFTPPVQRVTILGINLPEPDTFGPYDRYVALLKEPDSINPFVTLLLLPTEDKQNWVTTILLTFGGTLPNINVEIRPASESNLGEIILQGQVFP